MVTVAKAFSLQAIDVVNIHFKDLDTLQVEAEEGQALHVCVCVCVCVCAGDQTPVCRCLLHASLSHTLRVCTSTPTAPAGQSLRHLLTRSMAADSPVVAVSSASTRPLVSARSVATFVMAVSSGEVASSTAVAISPRSVASRLSSLSSAWGAGRLGGWEGHVG